VVMEPRPSRAIRSDMITNVYGRSRAARARSFTAAHDHEMPAAHPSDTSYPCFVEPRRHSRPPRNTSAIEVPFLDARRTSCALQSFNPETATRRHIDNCVSACRTGHMSTCCMGRSSHDAFEHSASVASAPKATMAFSRFRLAINMSHCILLLR
jgi:hypothetical protein